MKKGDVVAGFDRQDMENRLDDFEAGVRQAEASMKRFQAELEVARKAHEHSIRVAKSELDKARLDLKTIPVRSTIQTETLRLAAEEAEASYEQILKEAKYLEASLRAQLRVAELSLAEAKVETQRVERDVDRMLMKAPIDGLVVMQTTWRGGEMGQIQLGDQVHPGQPFMRIVDPDSMVVSASVNQVDAEMLRIGAHARVRFDAYPDLELPARVYSIGAITRASGFRADFVKEIPVTLRLERMDPRVIPDLSVSVDVVVNSEADAIIAPRESVFQTGGGEKPYVFVQTKSGWQRREVELGRASHTTVAVRDGLRAGEVVALERPPSTPKKV
ncbi:MAG TPA: HlyD family efflux transporter periplasmic adaptor subunit [Bryobacteraceae bacterium]|nr:HlyD family efflux transporter periplasmic adaptor subunit [Bryobacteraceae bacterium]